ncbi:MAG: DUF1987 domain-containing protein [Bacteroidota bacterium]|nr:DUF1987 domain-containing protein [Bacteroidota bacterium]
MDPLMLKSTPKTPEVNFDNNSGIFEIKGMSCAEYALDFYNQVFEWLDDYIKHPKPKTVLNIQFKYFNTSSAKCVLQLLERFSILSSNNHEVVINWIYSQNDEQMLHDGENYSEILGMEFNLKEI